MELTGLLNYALFMGILIGVYALLALALNIHWGFTGLFNAGIAGFFAVGAYVSAILTGIPAAGRLGGFEMPVLIGWLGAMIAAAAIAWPIGRICLRLRSDYLAIATIGVAEIIRLVIKSEDWLTGGPRGITGIPRPFGDLDYMASQAAYLALVVAVVAVVYWAVERQLHAPWGRMMRAIRDNEVSSAAMGKDINRRRLEMFVLGNVIIGIGGAALVTFTSIFDPSAFVPLNHTFLIWVMVILGGAGNNLGTIFGVVLVYIIWTMSEPAALFLFGQAAAWGDTLFGWQAPADLSTRALQMRVFVIGLTITLVLRFAPNGLLPEKPVKYE